MHSGISKWTWNILFNIEEDDIGKIIRKKCDQIVAKQNKNMRHYH